MPISPLESATSSSSMNTVFYLFSTLSRNPGDFPLKNTSQRWLPINEGIKKLRL